MARRGAAGEAVRAGAPAVKVESQKRVPQVHSGGFLEMRRGVEKKCKNDGCGHRKNNHRQGGEGRCGFCRCPAFASA